MYKIIFEQLYTVKTVILCLRFGISGEWNGWEQEREGRKECSLSKIDIYLNFRAHQDNGRVQSKMFERAHIQRNQQQQQQSIASNK